MAHDAQAETDLGILQGWIYITTYCPKDGHHPPNSLLAPQAYLLQAGCAQHKRCNRKGIEMNVFKLIEDNKLQLHGDIEYFAHLVAEAEREACAKVAEDWQVGIAEPRYQADCAAAIRARSEK